MIPKYFIKSKNNENGDILSFFPEAVEIKAFDGDQLDNRSDVILPINNEDSSTDISSDQLAHSLSHILAIKTAYENGDKGAFIIEDTISGELKSKWRLSLEEIVAQIPEKCYCITFQCNEEVILTSMLNEWIGDETLLRKWDTLGSGTGMYYINRIGMSRIVRLFYRKEKYNISLRLKNYLIDGRLGFSNLNTYMCYMPTVINLLDQSIENPQTKRNNTVNDLIKQFYAKPNSFIKKFKSDLPCYYINMERSPDRQAFMEKYFDKITRIQAYDGRLLKAYTDLFLPSDISRTRFRPTISQLGCSFSHINMIKTAYDAGHKEALFFEDDMWPKYITRWKLTIDQIIAQKPKDAQCLQFYCNNGKCLAQMIQDQSLFSLWQPNRWGAAAYYINRAGMKKLMNMYVNEKGIVLPNNLPNYVADDTIVFRYLKTYSCNIPTFQGRMFTSTIHTCAGPQDNSSLHEPSVIKEINSYYST
jgi:GR25 family glycosyltransferase involved in LPS biosynthesis